MLPVHTHYGAINTNSEKIEDKNGIFLTLLYSHNAPNLPTILNDF